LGDGGNLVGNRQEMRAVAGRAEVFRRETGTSKTLFKTFITTRGLVAAPSPEEILNV
jgi:hypothetical protein